MPLLKFIGKIRNLHAARAGLALLLLAVLLLSGCARKITAVAKVETEDHSVEEVIATLNKGVEPAKLYKKVYSQQRVVSVVLEGFTSEENMRTLADAVAQKNIPVIFIAL